MVKFIAESGGRSQGKTAAQARITELEAEVGRLKEQVRELQVHRDNAWEGSGGMPSYVELEAEVERLNGVIAVQAQEIDRLEVVAYEEAVLEGKDG